MKAGVALVVLVVLSVGCGTTSAAVPNSDTQPAGSPWTIAWDGINNRMVMAALIHNLNNQQQVDASTWYFTGSRWAKVEASQVPPQMVYGHAELVYDSDRHREVFIVAPALMPNAGGSQGVWVSTGRSWMQLATSHKLPPMSQDASAAYSPDLHATVLIDTFSATTQDPYRTWLFDGADWRSVATPHWPANSGFLSYDPRRHRIVALSDHFVTWQFDGHDWTAIAAGDASTPAISSGMGRQAPAVAFDPRTGHWVVFGGTDGGQAFADTWIGDGSVWTRAAPAVSPTSRFAWNGRSNMAWDPSDSEIVMFGGEGSVRGPDLSDTWSWDGNRWSRLAGPAYPESLPSPSALTTASSARTPAPASPVPIPETLGLKCTLPVALTGNTLANRQNPERGAFIDFATGTLVADPAGAMKWDTGADANLVDTVATPVLHGNSGLTYDRPLARWIPVSSAQVKRDGTAYTYGQATAQTIGSPTSIHVVDVASGSDRVVYLASASDYPIAFAPEGIYFSHFQWESPSVGLFLLDPATGRVSAVDSAGWWSVVGASEAWGFAGRYGGLGSPTQHVDRLDLKSGQITQWLTASGQDSLWVTGLDAAGRPIVQVSQPGGDAQSYRVITAAGVTQPLFSSDNMYLAGPLADQHGLWFRGDRGIYLFSGGALHYAYASTQDKIILFAAAGCQ